MVESDGGGGQERSNERGREGRGVMKGRGGDESEGGERMGWE